MAGVGSSDPLTGIYRSSLARLAKGGPIDFHAKAWIDDRAGSAWILTDGIQGRPRGGPWRPGAYSPLKEAANFPGLFSGRTTQPAFISALGIRRGSRWISPPCDRANPAGRRSLCRPRGLRPGKANEPRREPSVTGLSASPRRGPTYSSRWETDTGDPGCPPRRFRGPKGTPGYLRSRDDFWSSAWNLSRIIPGVNGLQKE